MICLPALENWLGMYFDLSGTGPLASIRIRMEEAGYERKISVLTGR